MQPIVEFSHVTMDFPGIRANDDVTLSIRKGEIFALVGENGAGKSTLMNILYGILTDMNLVDRVIVASFDRATINYLEENYPDLTRCASNVEAAKLFLDSLLGFDKPEDYYKFEVLQVPPDRYIANLGTSRLLNYAHKNNVAVQYWTINDTERMLFLRDIGADGIITDIPDVAYEVLKAEKTDN